MLSPFTQHVNVFILTSLMSCLWLTEIIENVHGQGVYIQFMGVNLSNNSDIAITDIGEGESSVLCITDKSNCCRSTDGGAAAGHWYFPNNGSTVGIEGNGHGGSFYRDRLKRKVRLHRRHDAMMPTGLFCCVVPDASGQNQKLCVMVEATPQTSTEVPENTSTMKSSVITKGNQSSDFTTTTTAPSALKTTTVTTMEFTTPKTRTTSATTITDIKTYQITIVDKDAVSKSTTHMTLTRALPLTTYSEHDSTEISGNPQNTTIIIASASVATLLVILVLLVLIFACTIILRRRKTLKACQHGSAKVSLANKDSHKPEPLELNEMMNNYHDQPIPLAQFVEHVDEMHENRDDLFEEEFNSFCTTPQAAHDVSSIPYNDDKNRFLNIFPYDYNRVKLKEIPGVHGSDYINASFINGYCKDRAYIAAQGPLPNSLEDFWRMVWEQKLPTIVMLTKCFEERKKCECYWPENREEALKPGKDLTINLVTSIPFSEFVIRKMTVKSTFEPDELPLEVTQLHFTAWPDHGVPSNTSVMLNIIRRVRKINPYSNPRPLLIHCSAGVGRTGTFIVLDSMLERMKSEKTLNIFEFVQQLREERVFMVQSLAQYMFIHDALKEFILCGETEVLAPNLGIIINKLSKMKDGVSGFEQQFQTLERFYPKLDNDSFSSATAEWNLNKNRYPDKIPCEGCSRVTLKGNIEQGSDYINASFIDGYKQRKAYIATQGPLKSTVNDFWRMVWEQKSCCIVMLCQLEENDKEMSAHYWPINNEPQTYGKLMVKKLSHEKRGDVVVRKFEVDEKRRSSLLDLKTAFTVTQFQFLVWKEHEIPPIGLPLVELVNGVNKVQMGSGNRPMVVMCNDGVGRTGTFVCIHAQLERLKTEGVVDLFQFVKSARMQRPGLIASVGQYELCHLAVLQYLQSVDTYENFKDVV